MSRGNATKNAAQPRDAQGRPAFTVGVVGDGEYYFVSCHSHLRTGRSPSRHRRDTRSLRPYDYDLAWREYPPPPRRWSCLTVD